LIVTNLLSITEVDHNLRAMTLSSAVLLIFQDSVGIIHHLDKPGAVLQPKTAGNMVVSGALIQMVLSVSAWLVFQQTL